MLRRPKHLGLILCSALLLLTLFFWIRGQFGWVDSYSFHANNVHAHRITARSAGVEFTCFRTPPGWAAGYDAHTLDTRPRFIEGFWYGSDYTANRLATGVEWSLVIPYFAICLAIVLLYFLGRWASEVPRERLRAAATLTTIIISTALAALTAVIWAHQSTGSFDSIFRLPRLGNCAPQLHFREPGFNIELLFLAPPPPFPRWRGGHTYVDRNRPFVKYPFEMLRVYLTDTPAYTDGVTVNNALIVQLPYWLLILLLLIHPSLQIQKLWRTRREKKLFEEAVAAKRAELQKSTSRVSETQ